MRLAVLCSPESWYLNDLRRAAADRHELPRVEFHELASAWDGTRLQVTAGAHDLAEFDAILIRTMPPGSLEQVVFRMDALARLETMGVVTVNPPRAIETAVDKYLASAKLAAAGLTCPRIVVCQGVDDAMAAFEQLGGDVVVKPLFGGEGRGITRLQDEELAWRAFKMLQQWKSVLYLQEYVPHEGFDIRLLVVGDRVLGMRRINPQDWRTNVSRGARTEPFAVDAEWVALTKRAADAVGASVAGVDVLPAHDGKQYVLEVNAVPGWKALASTLEIDVAAMVLHHVTALVGRKGS